jgi:hypothetical protein
MEPQGEYLENPIEENQEMEDEEVKEPEQIIMTSKSHGKLNSQSIHSQSQSQMQKPAVEEEDQTQYSCLGEFMIAKIPKN